MSAQDDGTPRSRQLFDRFNRPISVGDGLMIPGKVDTVWRVANLTATLRPDLPPGMIEITLVAAYKTLVPGGTIAPDTIRVLEAKDAPRDPKEPL